MAIKEWKLPQPREEEAKVLSLETGLDEVVCRILLERGISDGASALEMIHSEGPLSSPYALRDMDKAVERIRLALRNGERMAVFGDYDCDGITATALLVEYLQTIGGDVIYYLPSREEEGYGLNRGAVDFLRTQNATLIITVDNGISAHEEIAYAARLGIDVVITDHHTPRDTLPPAVAIIDPHRSDDTSGLTDLAGVGVAFKLACALEEDEEGWEMLEYYADLVAIGTVADVVPLLGENRRMVRHGLTLLAQTERAGLSALLEIGKLTERVITAETIAYGIAPRLNASGRMGSAEEAIDLLLTDDIRYAQEVAQGIEEQNILRKQTEEAMTAQIDAMLAESPQLLEERLVLVAGDNWHQGVVGIVASKLLERTGKPAFVFTREGDTVRGSARSLPGFSVIEAVTACSEHLTQYGGHPLAAGVTLAAQHLDAFQKELQHYAATHHPVMPLPRLEADCELAPRLLTVEQGEALSGLEPFGAGNRPPLFLFRELTVEGVRSIGEGKHLRLQFSKEAASISAVYFQMREEHFPYIPGDRLDVLASVSLSTYGGRKQISVIVRDLRRSGVPQQPLLEDAGRYACHRRGEYGAACPPEALLPSRDELAIVYRYLRKAGGYPYEVETLYYRLVDSGISYGKLLVSLEVLEEMALLTRRGPKGENGYYCIANPPQVDLEHSRVLQGLRSRISSNGEEEPGQ